MRIKKRKGRLDTEDLSLGSTDDAYYLAESWFRGAGKVVGHKLGMTDKQIKKKNELLKTIKELESKTHHTHSTWERNHKTLQSFQKPIFDAKLSKIKKVLKRLPVKD